MTMSANRQRNAVSEGMALGLVMCQRFTLPWDKVMVDLSFEGAWPAWAYRHRFSQVSTDLRNGSDGALVMTRADEAKHTFNFYWDATGRELVICARASWSEDVPDYERAARTIGGDVPPDGWRVLALSFLEVLEQ